MSTFPFTVCPMQVAVYPPVAIHAPSTAVPSAYSTSPVKRTLIGEGAAVAGFDVGGAGVFVETGVAVRAGREVGVVVGGAGVGVGLGTGVSAGRSGAGD